MRSTACECLTFMVQSDERHSEFVISTHTQL